MPHVSIRDLQRNAGGVVKKVAASGRPTVVTSRGEPVAAVVPIAAADLEDWIMANAPDFVAGRTHADAELSGGETTSLDDFLAAEGDASVGPPVRSAPAGKAATKTVKRSNSKVVRNTKVVRTATTGRVVATSTAKRNPKSTSTQKAGKSSKAR